MCARWPVRFEDLGEQRVKNIAQPIRAFRVRDAGDVPPAESTEAPVAAQPPGPAEQHAADPAEFELAFWESIKESEDPGEFAAYLEQYPTGAFIALAEARRQSLLQPDAQPAPANSDIVAVELAFWNTVKDSDNPAMYEAYLERYPHGAFAALAKLRLGELGSSPPP